ncbi:MAG TPA: hypothetical protein VEI03_14130 [Stellaceae bacterium]|nr:hypothetical protein [Stellaceae bacterium]
MPAPFTLRTPLGGFEREPRGYDDLRRLALGYAKDEFAGRTLCNHPTQLAITLSPAALAAATRPGAPSALLWAIPDLPALLSHALYVRTVADPRRRPDIRRVHLLAARAEIAGRPVELLFAVRETFGGQCFLDRVSERSASMRHRQDGGGIADGIGEEAADDTSDEPARDVETSEIADDGVTDAETAPTSSDSSRVNTASQAGKWLDPNSKYARFFDQQFAAVAEVATDLGVDPTLLLGLSAHESGWGKPENNYAKNLNPFGATPLGDSTSGLRFQSYRDAWQAWARTFGPRVAGVGSDAAAFLRNLEYDNRRVYGPTIGGNYRGAYNSEDENWKKGVAEAIAGVRRRLPLWQGNLDSPP